MKKAEIKENINRVLVCSNCNFEPVPHEVQDTTGEIRKAKHCPQCFNQSNFKLVSEEEVRK